MQKPVSLRRQATAPKHNPPPLYGGINQRTRRMKVLKFGGTSVGSVESILCLKAIVEKEAQKQPVIIVVSALGGITDKLLATSQLALKGDEAWKDEFQTMVDRHHKMIDTIITDTRKREICLRLSIRCLSSCALSILVYSLSTTFLRRHKTLS